MLQKYKSHKTVLAGKIQGIRTEERIARPVVTALVVGGHEYLVPENFSARGTPEVGDYLVRYEGGYLSWSPAKAFEDGYMLIEDVTGATVGQIEDAINRGEYVNLRPDGGVEMTNAAKVQRPCDTEDDIQSDGSVDSVEVGDTGVSHGEEGEAGEDTGKAGALG